MEVLADGEVIKHTYAQDELAFSAFWDTFLGVCLGRPWMTECRHSYVNDIPAPCLVFSRAIGSSRVHDAKFWCIWL